MLFFPRCCGCLDGKLYISKGHILKFPNKKLFLSLKIVFVIANSENPDEMLHKAAFHLGLHCLSKYTNHQYTKG